VNLRSTTHLHGSSTKSRFASGCLTTSKTNAVRLGLGCRLLPGVAPIHVGQLHALASRFLHALDERLYLRPLLLGGRGALQGE
jgi:hypothetical protein